MSQNYLPQMVSRSGATSGLPENRDFYRRQRMSKGTNLMHINFCLERFGQNDIC